jgi:all-trans-retinol 13,14-reductase
MLSNNFRHTIVIGSGMGGMSCAAALAHHGHKVLLLEQAAVAGGLTHSFSRNGWSWDVGLHYVGEYAQGGLAGPLLGWLSDGAIRMASMGPVYDTLHFPGAFDFMIARPEEAFKAELKDRFPASAKGIDAFFAAMRDAQHAGHRVFAHRGMPEPVAAVSKVVFHRSLQKWCARTTQQVLDEFFDDPKIKAVLSAQWGDYGGPPAVGSFAMHALIIREYFEGAYYPVGGAGVIAPAMARVITGAGGEVRTNAAVTALLVEDGAVKGVRTANGDEYRADHVVSNIGARNTVLKLLPPALQDSVWAQEVLSFPPSVAHVSLYLGFEGDIAAHGATRSNHWVYDTWDPGLALWNNPSDTEPPVCFISFPSLKDPAHDPGPNRKNTGEVVVLCAWEPFATYAGARTDALTPEYQVFKHQLGSKVLAVFAKQFPALVPLIKHQELATPLATVAYTGAYHGAFYGLETSPRRFLSSALNARTPVPGLYMSGQDVGSPGINGSMWGGVMCAGAIDPRVFQHI